MQKRSTPESRDPHRRGARRQSQPCRRNARERLAPDVTPPDLPRAHSALDRAIERIYRRGRFTSERERIETLATGVVRDTRYTRFAAGSQTIR